MAALARSRPKRKQDNKEDESLYTNEAIPVYEALPNECPKCRSNRSVDKNGTRMGKQRYICKKCDTTFYERGIVTSRQMMARQVIILTLLGKSQTYIALTLNVGAGTVTKYLKEYTQMDKFGSLIPLPNERTSDTHLVDVVDVKLKAYILRNWRDKRSKQAELFDERRKTKKASR